MKHKNVKYESNFTLSPLGFRTFCSLLHVKNCVLYIDISVAFAFDSCVEISKFP